MARATVDTNSVATATRALCVLASSFTATPLQEPLERALLDQALACDVALAQYAELPRFLLSPDDLFGTRPILASVVLLRVEDWLRCAGADAQDTPGRRRLLSARVDETVEQVAAASTRGTVFVCCCPSRGAVARRTDTATLCQTATAVLSMRLRATRAVLLPWAAFEEAHTALGAFDDPGADRLGQVPFTQGCFEAWALHLARVLAPRLRRTSDASAAGAPATALEAYLAGLDVRVSLRPWQAQDAPDSERLSATVTAFRSTHARGTFGTGSSGDWVVQMHDRTGDYGTCGLLSLGAVGDALVVESFMLSCPVLGKRVEHAVVLGLLRMARARQCTRLRLHFETSAANAGMARFFESFAEPEVQGNAGLRIYTCAVTDAQRSLARLAGTADCDLAELPRS